MGDDRVREILTKILEVFGTPYGCSVDGVVEILLQGEEFSPAETAYIEAMYGTGDSDDLRRIVADSPHTSFKYMRDVLGSFDDPGLRASAQKNPICRRKIDRLERPELYLAAEREAAKAAYSYAMMVDGYDGGAELSAPDEGEGSRESALAPALPPLPTEE